MKAAYSLTNTLPGGRKSNSEGLSRKNSRCTRVQTSRPSVSMLTLVTPSLAAGRYSSSFTPRAEGSSLPPAALMRSTSDTGTEEEPCMTMGMGAWPAAFTLAAICSITSKCKDCWPLNLYAPWLVPMAAASASQPERWMNSTASLGLVSEAWPSSTAMSSSTPPSCPSSASTERPLAWARSTTRRVMAMFSSKESCEASIITDE